MQATRKAELSTIEYNFKLLADRLNEVVAQQRKNMPAGGAETPRCTIRNSRKMSGGSWAATQNADASLTQSRARNPSARSINSVPDLIELKSL